MHFAIRKKEYIENIFYVSFLAYDLCHICCLNNLFQFFPRSQRIPIRYSMNEQMSNIQWQWINVCFLFFFSISTVFTESILKWISYALPQISGKKCAPVCVREREREWQGCGKHEQKKKNMCIEWKTKEWCAIVVIKVCRRGFGPLPDAQRIVQNFK